MPIDVRVRPLYNPALKSALFIVPGIIGMILSNILIIITAMAIVREREFGTLEQLIVTPLTRSEIMLGKIAPYVGVGLVQITAVLIVGHLLFRVPIRGSLLLIYVVSLLFIIASLGLGLFISTLASARPRRCRPRSSSCCRTCCCRASCSRARRCRRSRARSGCCCRSPTTCRSCAASCSRASGCASCGRRCLALVGFAVLFFTFSTLRFHKQLE